MRRRTFIAGTTGAVLLAGRGARAAAGRPMLARHYRKLGRQKIQCQLCPSKCKVEPGERGECGVRENRSGSFYTLVHSNPCAVHNDPIEKKPLFHFRPGSHSLSIATPGCNLECEFCQNWRISQAKPEDIETVQLGPEDAAALAVREGSRSIALTYTEPVVFFEYMYDVAVAGRRRDIPAVMISNGYIQAKPMAELCTVLGAVKIDFKAFDARFYEDRCAGELQPVLDTLELLALKKMWFEMVHLTIPTLNDAETQTRAMCQWILGHLGPDVPIHFTRFHPDYRLRSLPRTPIQTLARQREIALEVGLHYAYAGNVPGDAGENTYCHGCGELVIRRLGFRVVENALADGRCPKCKTRVPGVWD